MKEATRHPYETYIVLMTAEATGIPAPTLQGLVDEYARHGDALYRLGLRELADLRARILRLNMGGRKERADYLRGLRASDDPFHRALADGLDTVWGNPTH